MEGQKYYYKANQVHAFALDKVRSFCPIYKLDHNDGEQRFQEMVEQLQNQFVLIKHTIEQQAFKTYTILEIEGESATPFKMPPGVKPILIYKETALIKKKFEGGFKIGLLKYKHQGVTATSVLELSFCPKFVLNLDSIKDNLKCVHVMLVGKSSIDDFAIVKLQGDSMTLLKKSGCPTSLTKILSQQDKLKHNVNFLKSLRVQGIEVLDQDQSSSHKDSNDQKQNQKLVIMNIFNSQTDQYCFFTMLLLHKKAPNSHPSWEFILTDSYFLKPQKIVHSFSLSHYHQKETDTQEAQFNQNFAKIIVSYDCSKLIEIMVNTNPQYLSQKQDSSSSDKEKPRFIRKVTKLKHQINFGKLSQCLKIQGSSEFVVQDLHQRIDQRILPMSFLSIIRPQRKIAKSSRLSEIQDQSEIQHQGDQNLLLFDDQEIGESLNFLVPLSDTILILHAREGLVQLMSIVRVSINELIQFYLETKNDLIMANNIVKAHGLEDSTIILEYQLKQLNYNKKELLTKFLSQNLNTLEGSNDTSKFDAVFKKLTYVILKQRVDSLESIQTLVDSCQKVLLDKMIAAGQQNEDDLLFLRQLLWYQKRLALFKKLQDLQGVTFQTLQSEDSAQQFMLNPDFIGGICNQVLYQHTTLNDQDTAYTLILSLILALNFHEVCLNFEAFLSILQFERLGIEIILEILPSIDKMSKFWVNVKSICSECEYFQKSKQIEVLIGVAEELLTSGNQSQKALQLVKGGIEMRGLTSKEMCQLGMNCVQNCEDILPDQEFNQLEVVIPLEGIKLLSFRSIESPLDVFETLDIIQKYFNEAKFVFHRERDLYKDYLKQLRYFTSFIIDRSLREEFLVGLLRSQGARTNQFTLDDSDLVQILLDLIYSPTFQPNISEVKGMGIDLTSDEKIKFMKFVPETIEFIQTQMMPLLCLDQDDQQFDDQLVPSENQKKLIEQHLVKHLKIGRLDFMSTVWLPNHSNNDDDDLKKHHKTVLELDQNNLRFVDLLKIQNSTDNNQRNSRKFLEKWIEDIIDIQIKLSGRKREALKTLKTQVATSLFDIASSGLGGIFQSEGTQGGQQPSQQDQKWTQLFEQISEMISLLNHQDSIEFSQLFINKMLHSGNFQAMREIMGRSTTGLGSQQDLKSQIGEVVLSDIQDKFNDLQFSGRGGSDLSQNGGDESQLELVEFYKFRQKSQEFLSIMIKEQDDQEFIEKCQEEVGLLEASEELVKNQFLLSIIPVTQVREDWGSNQLLKRVLQIHGLKELLFGNQNKDLGKLLKSFSKLIKPFLHSQNELKKSQMVIFEIMMFMSENKLYQDEELNQVFKSLVQDEIIDSSVQFEHLMGSKYERVVQKNLVEMLKQDIAFSSRRDSVAPPPDDFAIKLSKFLIAASDKSQISSHDLDQICQVYIENHSKRPKQNIQNLVLALQTRKEHKSLSLMSQDFECLLKDLQPFQLPYSDIKFMLTIQKPQDELQVSLKELIKRNKRATKDFAGLILNFIENGEDPRAMEISALKALPNDIILQDSENFQDFVLSQLRSNCQLPDSESLCSIKVGTFLDSLEQITEETITTSLQALSEQSPQNLQIQPELSHLLLLSHQLGISLTSLTQSIFPASNLQTELAQSTLPQSKFLKFLISKLGLRAAQNLLLIEFYNKVDDACLFVLLEVFSDIDDLFSGQNYGIGFGLGLTNICVLAKWLNNCFAVVKYQRDPIVHIEQIYDFVQWGDEMNIVVEKANSILVEEFQIDKKYLIHFNRY